MPNFIKIYMFDRRRFEIVLFLRMTDLLSDYLIDCIL